MAKSYSACCQKRSVCWLIIKNKNICKKRRIFCQKSFQFVLTLFFALASGSNAIASESLVNNGEPPFYENVPQIITDVSKIEKAAEFASSVTGVRKDFLMGMLVVESDLGRNPGKCTYREVEEGAEEAHKSGNLSFKAWNTFKERRETIKKIAESLNYDYEKLRVSCNPDGVYAGTGGAMGIPQFMPDTWLEYKDRVAEIVGKNNPDPWNAKDGVVAMALKLSDVYGVTAHDTFAERNAAKLYLSGTTSWEYDWYANQILYWSKNYKELIG